MCTIDSTWILNSYSSLEFHLLQEENSSLYFHYLLHILQGKEFSGSEECIEKVWREALLETSGSSLSSFPSPSSLNPGTFVVGICSVKPYSNISFHFHDNSSLSTSEGTACIVNKPLLAIGLFSFSISSSICSKALLQKEVGCRCVLFLSLPPPLLFLKEVDLGD